MVYSATGTATPMVLVAMSKDIPFSLSDGGVLESVRSVFIILTLLLSGFFAARFGKVRSLGWSCLLLAVAIGIYAISPVYGFLLVALAIVGVGGGVVEALLNPLIEELHREDSGRYLNIINAFFPAGVLITVLTTGELLTRGVSWRYIIGGLAIGCLLAGVLFLSLRNAGPPRQRTAMVDVLRHKTGLVKSGTFWLFTAMMFCAGAAEGALTFWSASYIQIHHGGLPRAAGIGVAAFAGGMVAGRIISGWLLRQDRLRSAILLSAVAGTVICGALPLVNQLGGIWFVLFLAGLSVACFWPSIQAFAVDCLPHESTAIFILLSCGGIGGFGFASWLLGVLAERFGFVAALFCVPSFFIVLVLLTAAAPNARRQLKGT